MSSISPSQPPQACAQDVPRGADVVELRPRRGWQAIDFAELWQYRELLGFLALRDVQVRYKQAALGALWAIIQPLSMMVVLQLVLGWLGRSRDPIFLFAGLLPWTFFAGSVIAANNSLVANASMLRKIYVPRLLFPIAALGATLVDYLIAFGVLVLMMLWYQTPVTPQLALIPALVFTTILAALGIGILTAGLTVAYRDFKFVVPSLVQIGMFISPVMYDAKQVPSLWFHLNPMSGMIAGFRSAVLGTPVDYTAWGISTASACVFLCIGLFQFAKTQRRFADIV